MLAPTAPGATLLGAEASPWPLQVRAPSRARTQRCWVGSACQLHSVARGSGAPSWAVPLCSSQLAVFGLGPCQSSGRWRPHPTAFQRFCSSSESFE